ASEAAVGVPPAEAETDAWHAVHATPAKRNRIVRIVTSLWGLLDRKSLLPSAPHRYVCDPPTGQSSDHRDGLFYCDGLGEIAWPYPYSGSKTHTWVRRLSVAAPADVASDAFGSAAAAPEGLVARVTARGNRIVEIACVAAADIAPTKASSCG